ncbi:MAG: hypothetical protein V4712_17630 [Pseudomonadota bacterium]
MADAPFRLSLADQALINLCGYLGAQTMDDANTAVALDALAEVLPHVTRTHPLLAALAEAAGAIHTAAPNRRKIGTTWWAACLDLDRALAAIFFWRAGGALDAFRMAQVPTETPDLFATKEPA